MLDSINIDNGITLESYGFDGSIHWSEIIRDNKVIGALAERRQGILQPLKVWVQICVDDKYNMYGDFNYPTENDGKIFVCFWDYEGIEKLIYFIDNILE